MRQFSQIEMRPSPVSATGYWGVTHGTLSNEQAGTRPS